MLSAKTLTTKVTTAAGYTLSGVVSGYTATNIYNSAGVLQEQDVFFSKTSMIKYIPKADGTVEQHIFINGKETQADTYNTVNKLISSKLYATDGVTVKETDTYHYTSTGLMADKIRYNAAGTYIEKVDIVYNLNKTINTFVHTDIKGHVTEIDYFNNGVLDHITMQPAAVTPFVPVVAPLVAGWSGIDGYGNIDMLKALTAETGKAIVDITPTAKLGWGITASHFDDAWAAGYTGKGIVIAEIDTGIDMNNKALTGNLSKYSWNFLTQDKNIQDDNGHGSFVASEMIATDVGNGIVGAASGAELMVLKALNMNGAGSASTIANAITYAVDHGANIINMSLIGGTADMPSIHVALQYAQSHNVFVAIAAGNSAGSSPTNPAFYAKTLDTVVAVGSSANNVGSDLTFSTFSNKTGANTAYDYVTAGGTNIQGYDQNGHVVTLSGTSMASAYVAAGMAILEQASFSSHSGAAHSVLVQDVMGSMIHNTDAISLVGVAPIPTSLA
jgi:subtilisin family serine protease